ncbi:short-subunit dehydrogenase [Paraburkholderia caballeronis]|uniref:SDR family oxidoreductase n=1 Tax=Paraburkholderia caballeronis TaxID=416943 RepID=UPI00106496A0|nr:SDR family oxidoreductase [Paraburkholderia caballeronis]TDV35877.1 short-subunit dehydrogenase [Paraburkholderia caballeronis]
MKIEGAVVFVTGANRGLGLEFARQALARGASKVYAGARDPSTVKLPGVIPVKLDVTQADEVAAAAAQCKDVTLLINNAGIARIGAFTEGDPVPQLREQLETNLFGIVNTSRAFAGILGANGGGALLNVLSVVSWISTPLLGTYGVTKAAVWSLTNTLRIELKAQGTQVVGFHAGFIDTDLTQGLDVPKARPEDVVRASYDAIEAGAEEVAADEASRQVKQGLSHGVYLTDVTAA